MVSLEKTWRHLWWGAGCDSCMRDCKVHSRQLHGQAEVEASKAGCKCWSNRLLPGLGLQRPGTWAGHSP